MAGLGDFVSEEDSSTETLHLMNIEYKEQFGDPITHLWCRTRDNEERHVEVEGHLPSFFILRDAYKKRVKNHDWVHHVEGGYQSIQGRELVRVYCKLPKHVSGKRDQKGLREYFDTTWEADVFYCNRFLIDTGIKTHLEVDLDETWGGQSVEGDYRVHVDDIDAAEDVGWQADPRTLTVDIEVESPDGFPEPRDADQPVTAITAHDNYEDTYTVWVLRHDEWKYSDTEIQNLTIENRPDSIEVEVDEDDDGEPITEELTAHVEDVRVYEDEASLLHNFNEWVGAKNPDLLGGWNSSSTDNGYPFDYPYLINRCRSLNTMSFREWSPLGEVWTGNWGPNAKGVAFHDMLKAYKKTQFTKPKGGYSLDNITSTELPVGDGKLDLDDLDSAWRDEPAEFLKYNIRDVQAVVGIDKSAEVTDLFQNLRKLTGAQWGDCHNNIDLLDHFILRYADDFGVRLPTNEEPDRGWYYGAYNFIPKFGRHPNAVYPDLWSMYPNMIRNCNMSPETMIGTKNDLDASEYTEEDCRWTYIDTRATNVKEDSDPEYEKLYFLKPTIKKGFMTNVVDDLMGLKDAYDGTDLYGPVKQVVNSVYGVYGDSDSYGKGYRLFDWRIAEGICLGGRLQIQDSADRFVGALNAIKDERGYDGRNAYLVGGDTDSCMASIPFVDIRDSDQEVNLTTDDGLVTVPAYYKDYRQVVDLAHDAADRVNDWYDEWTAETFNLTDGEHYCELEIESYSTWLYIPEPATASAEGKKRYAKVEAWEEGDWYFPPEFSVTGIDVVRSDRAVVTRETVRDVLETILRVDDREEARRGAYEAIKTTVEEIKSGDVPNSYIARPKGMGQSPSEYGSASKRPSSTYRGAKYANQHFDWERMGEGSKPQLLAIDKVRGGWAKTYDAETAEDGDAVDCVSLEQPDKLPDEFVIDYDVMIEKTLEDPLTPILAPMGWDFDEALADTEQADIASFM